MEDKLKKLGTELAEIVNEGVEEKLNEILDGIIDYVAGLKVASKTTDVGRKESPSIQDESDPEPIKVKKPKKTSKQKLQVVEKPKTCEYSKCDNRRRAGSIFCSEAHAYAYHDQHRSQNIDEAETEATKAIEDDKANGSGMLMSIPKVVDTYQQSANKEHRKSAEESRKSIIGKYSAGKVDRTKESEGPLTPVISIPQVDVPTFSTDKQTERILLERAEKNIA